ncbi:MULTISPECIES: hypothetical protein [unclassified Ensifer]|uniref:NACHT domain-containing protein n=1 Tax=unclassified Ensifer TaxID=2633371 RepID=UPI00070D95CF|nr:MULTISPECIES: hypothetical protein [unclassified Ensifer]KQW47199.1 hypothetical protein ASD02_34405 [Ensifer sp. Root1252]KRC68751.1 hypothetical protein ASE32_35235 [Ensifer sp. Root231]KRC93917.1 hypothetical protein ASE47_34900 [Ensifer sp. Root258]
MSTRNVPLKRKFLPVAADAETAEQLRFAALWAADEATSWSDLELEYRSVLLAAAGSGKTYEMSARAKHLEKIGKASFFIRIEDIGDRFEDAFEVGTSDQFRQWIEGTDEAWLFLDSVDEARLTNPRAFETALRRFAHRIRSAGQRAHIYISSRPYAWQFVADRKLIDQLLPFARPGEEGAANDAIDLHDDDEEAQQPRSAVQVYSLQPLAPEDIRLFSEHRGATNVDQLVREVERAGLSAMATRPFDLEALLEYWRKDGKLGSRLEVLQRYIGRRLDEIDPSRKRSNPLNSEKAREGARLLAAAVTLTGEPGINVPDCTSSLVGIDAEALLADWHPTDVWTLLERGLFNDVLYGAVRFRHREIQELLTAEWLHSLLEKGNSRRAVENLIFRQQYNEDVIAPRLRPVLPWLILFDEPIRRRVLSMQPEIAVEGGDPSRLPFHERRNILHDIVTRIVERSDDRSARSNDAIARIAHHDLSGDVQSLIEKHASDDSAISFLGRLVWQGNLAGCLGKLEDIARDPERGIFARIASARAVVTVGTETQRRALWEDINKDPAILPRQLLVELVNGASFNEQTVRLLLSSFEKLPPHNRMEASGLTQALLRFIDQADIEHDLAQATLLGSLVKHLHDSASHKPHIEDRDCAVSLESSWLMGPAVYAVERLVRKRSSESFAIPAIDAAIKAAQIRYWSSSHLEGYGEKLREIIPAWSKLNDAVFWRDVELARTALDASSGERLNDVWPLLAVDPWWRFKADSFPRVLDWVKTRQLDEDRMVAVSLAFHICTEAGRDRQMASDLCAAVEDEPDLAASLDQLIGTEASDKKSAWERRSREYASKRSNEMLEAQRKRSETIARLRADPDSIRSPDGVPPGKISTDQWLLFEELRGDGIRAAQGYGYDWNALSADFGEEVARACRDAAVAHWRVFSPGLRSEGADRSIPSALLFGMGGLEIEARERADFPTYMTTDEVRHALRYITWEINGFPNWLETMHRAFPQLAEDAIWRELSWQLDNAAVSGSRHYILEDIASYAPWLHVHLVEPLMEWLSANEVNNGEVLRYCFRILEGGALDPAKLAALARSKVANGGTNAMQAHWFSLWVATDPETAIPEVGQWLSEMDADFASESAQRFVTGLVGGRRWSGISSNQIYTASRLKALYVLMHKHIRTEDDIERVGTGVYSPDLRDDAQDARNHLFERLSKLPGKETYLALAELAREHPDEVRRAWMTKYMRDRAVEDADLEPWSAQQVREFGSDLNIAPATHKQLYEIGVSHLNDFKDWLERGDDSLAETFQKADDEIEMRKIVANWLNKHCRGRYTCAQENPLANNQRPDIWLQSTNIASPVPIELKLLDKQWSGPKLCERLRNQLAGDYLRQDNEACGIILLVWQGHKDIRHWEINGKSVPLEGLRDALANYWAGISSQFPNVLAVEILTIDLTLRTKKSTVL